MSKFHYSWQNFEDDIGYFTAVAEANKCDAIVTLYCGGLPLGTKLRNVLNIPLSILDYQSYDGNSKGVTLMKSHLTDKSKILLVDDIADTGNSLHKSIEFLNNHFNRNMDITVCTIHGNKEYKDRYNWLYCNEHNKQWIVYPWE